MELQHLSGPGFYCSRWKIRVAEPSRCQGVCPWFSWVPQALGWCPGSARPGGCARPCQGPHPLTGAPARERICSPLKRPSSARIVSPVCPLTPRAEGGHSTRVAEAAVQAVGGSPLGRKPRFIMESQSPLGWERLEALRAQLFPQRCHRSPTSPSATSALPWVNPLEHPISPA